MTMQAPGAAGADDPQWYQATTLGERLALFRHTLSQPPACQAQAEMERARDRLAQWQNQPPFRAYPQSFAQRLASDGLSAEQLLALCAISAPAIQSAHTAPPAWLEDIVGIPTGPRSSARFAPIAHKIDITPQLAFLRAFKPWLEQACTRLHYGVQALQADAAHLPFALETIKLLCLARLFQVLHFQLSRVMVLELHAARLQGRVQGETPEQRFDSFFQQLTQPAQVWALLTEYPVLARRISELTGNWLACELELLQRLCNDWDEIRQTFSPASDPGVLVRMHEGAGDTHHGGRSVVTLTWRSGLRLVYKPRAQTIDIHYQHLLHWLNAHGCQPSLRVPRVIDKGTYGWCAYIADDPCSSPAQVERFYQRLGGHMALLYALEATDLHAQNLIAAGEEPMLIDLEALLHPRFPDENASCDPFEELLDRSVMRVGLLPQRLFSTREHTGVDLSGLGARNGQSTPDRIAQMQAVGTDQMRITRAYSALEQSKHRPTLHAREVDALAYRADLIAGFTTVYRLLLRHRDELLDRLLPRFADVEVRVLPRATRLYASLLIESTHPDVLRDALELERLLDRLWIGVRWQPSLARLIPAERADLLRGDIPRFTTRPASRDLFTSQGDVLPAFFPEASLDLARARIQQLGEEDLEQQTWIIEAALASGVLSSPSPLGAEVPLQDQ